MRRGHRFRPGYFSGMADEWWLVISHFSPFHA
jgi:hypothetical protein